MSFALGNKPQDMTVYLNRDADFISTIRTTDGSDWPVGIVVNLELGASIWSATVVDDEVRFNVDKAFVGEVLDAKVYTAMLFYIDGSTELLWGRGKVISR